VASAAGGLTQLFTGDGNKKKFYDAEREILPWSSLISGGYKVHFSLGRRVTQTRSKSVLNYFFNTKNPVFHTLRNFSSTFIKTGL
jgi:hypothetical protein